ncbi:hypothetical protein EV702DRAFT_1283511 [Suillus placidus]|uniref:Uncharacterized protein n=1 Tax=Suillus placidus TaxID=48579 RepID=A0A9P6ZGA6_9AGAM|nr:hypothetical protein EV702DRAFT_1283511 [Suillus placidus]
MLPEKKVPAGEPQFVDTDTMARDNHINIVSVSFILYLLPTVPLRTRTHPHNISINCLLAQMTQSTSGSASSFLPQAQSLSVGQKRVAEDLEECDAKGINMGSGGTNNDRYLKPVLYQYGQCDGTYVCYKDGSVMRPGSHMYHTETAEHLGVLFKCPLSAKTYPQYGACKMHLGDGCDKLAAEGAPPSHSAACQGSMNSASASSVGLPTAAFTFSLPITVATTPETVLSEAAEDGPNPDSWAANEIRDTALVAPVLPTSQVREITLAEVHGDLDFWRWINDLEDFVDPVLPISELPSSQVREITLAEVHGDLDFWRWINDLEDFVDPVLPISELPSSQVREITLAEVHGDLDFWRWINDLEDSVDPVPSISELPSSQSLETMLTEAAKDPDRTTSHSFLLLPFHISLLYQLCIILSTFCSLLVAYSCIPPHILVILYGIAHYLSFVLTITISVVVVLIIMVKRNTQLPCIYGLEDLI